MIFRSCAIAYSIARMLNRVSNGDAIANTQEEESAMLAE
jgi:hypothetical protein